MESSKMKKTLTAVSLLAVLAVTGCTSTAKGDMGLSLEEKTGATAAPEFKKMEGTPEGWTSTLTAEIPEGEKEEAEAHFRLHPADLSNADKTCTYSQEPAMMPSYKLNRGEEFLSKDYIYEQSESNGSLPKGEPTSVPVETSAGKLEFAYAAYSPKVTDLKSNTDKNAKATDAKTVQVYRAVAVRVFDTLVEQKLQVSNPVTAPFGSDSTKILPGVVLTYECNTEEAFNEEEAKSLFAASRVEIKK